MVTPAPVRPLRLGTRGGTARLVLVALGTYAVAFLAFAVGPFDISTAARSFVGDAAFLPAGSVVGLLAWRASAAAPPGSVRRAWRWLAVAYLAYWAGDALYFYYDVVAREVPYPSLADGAYLAYYPLLLVGLVSFPRVLRSGLERIRFGLDVATVVLGGAMVVWYFVLGPIASQVEPDLLTTVLSIAYPVGDLVLLLGFAVIALRAPDALPTPVLRLLLVGLVFGLAADLGYGAQALDGTYEPGRLVDALYIVGWAFLGASAVLAREAGPAVVEPAARQERPDQLPMLPYLSVALGYGMLIAAIRSQWTPTVAGLTVGAVGLTALVVARQVAAVRENMRLLAEREAQRSEARFRSLVQNASDVIAVVDENLIVRYETPSVERVLGFRPEEMLGKSFVGRVLTDDLPAAESLLAQTRQRPGATASGEIRLVRSDGTPLFVWIHVLNLLDDAEIRGQVITFRDIDDRRRLETKLAHQAYHDPLTGLANRALFSESVAMALAGAAESHDRVAVLYLDIDNFKTVNDSLGHEAGDQALAEVTRRLNSSLRTGDLAARIGGDEFAVLLETPSSEEAAATVSRRILAALEEPFAVGDHEVSLRGSIGIALSASGDLREDLLRNADIAMYLAKANGKDRFATFEAGMQAPVQARLDIESGLRHALERDEFELDYQPIVDLVTRQAVGAEALIRWRRPGHGLVPPAQFIPLAEAGGMILPIGEWVLQAACRTAAGWPGSGRIPPFVTVNVSAIQLADPVFVEQVATALDTGGLQCDRLVLEITESLMLQDPDGTIERLRELKRLGIRIAIDDFGTGYSSLSHLRRLPADELKIDRSFVSDLDRATGAALVQGIIELGASIGLACIAEGIETWQQATALEAAGCGLGQGFYFARPVSSESIGRVFDGRCLPALEEDAPSQSRPAVAGAGHGGRRADLFAALAEGRTRGREIPDS